MKRTLIRYRTKPETAEENRRLIEKVFEELHAKAPVGIRYMALQLGDGSFIHLKIDEREGNDPIHDLQAFHAFQSGIRDRCSEAPKASEVSVIGNYRMLEA